MSGIRGTIRLAVLGLAHEANTFAPHRVDDDYFRAAPVLYGDEILARHSGGSSTIAGYLAAATAHPDVTVVPLVASTLVPAGMITAEALRTRADELVAALSAHGPFDGVLADLHGAAVATDVADVDGYLLDRFRQVVGPQVPIGVSLDLHANISARMCAHADVLNTYRTNPHVDAAEVAAEVAELVVRAVRGQIRPRIGFAPVPAAINILCQNTDHDPMRQILADAAAVATQPGVLSVTVAEGYPYADVPELGMSVVVVADGDQDLAQRHAHAVAARVWARRNQFDAQVPDAAEAVRLAAAAPRGPVLLLDVGDNIGGGSAGDSVVLLQAARQAGLRELLTIVADPVAAAACHRAGVGETVELHIGARSDPQTGPPVAAHARVRALHAGVHRAEGPVHAGMRDFDGGPTAAVTLDSAQTVVLTSRPVPPLSIATLGTVGLEPGEFQAIVAKGVHSPLAGYGPHVADVIWVDTPGVTSADLRRFHYVRRRRPLFPFEPEATYPPGR